MSQKQYVVVWFRRDLRLADNPALAAALETGAELIPLYAHDPDGEAEWSEGAASRWWLHHSLKSLDTSLRSRGSRLLILSGNAKNLLMRLRMRRDIIGVYWNRRYEPDSIVRDKSIKTALLAKGVRARSFNGSLLHSPGSLFNKSETPYRVFTPFWKRIRNMETRDIAEAPKRLNPPKSWPKGLSVDSLRLLPEQNWDEGFYESWHPGEAEAMAKLRRFTSEHASDYAAARDFPGANGISRLSPHLHFGELSPAQVWSALDVETHESYLRQIGWREFSYYLLYHFPDTTASPMRKEFQSFPWNRDARLFEAWKRGRTGYPIVDAGMRELWRTGWMHNRVRMLTASFLVKSLLQPWQDGAEWFWEALVDADLANNTMGWQWVAGCGADAAPYFRIFNPITQGQRFDPEGDYTRKWLPELRDLPNAYLFKPWETPESEFKKAGITLGQDYPFPIVEHQAARAQALQAYQQMRDKS